MKGGVNLPITYWHVRKLIFSVYGLVNLSFLLILQAIFFPFSSLIIAHLWDHLLNIKHQFISLSGMEKKRIRIFFFVANTRPWTLRTTSSWVFWWNTAQSYNWQTREVFSQMEKMATLWFKFHVDLTSPSVGYWCNAVFTELQWIHQG